MLETGEPAMGMFPHSEPRLADIVCSGKGSDASEFPPESILKDCTLGYVHLRQSEFVLRHNCFRKPVLRSDVKRRWVVV